MILKEARKRSQFHGELQSTAADYLNLVMQAANTDGELLTQQSLLRLTRLHHLMGLELQMESGTLLKKGVALS